jgi:hypothetical protein
LAEILNETFLGGYLSPDDSLYVLAAFPSGWNPGEQLSGLSAPKHEIA